MVLLLLPIITATLTLGVTTVSSLLLRSPIHKKSLFISSSSSSTRLYASDNSPLIQPGIGDEGCALPSPSRINTLSPPFQFAIFLAISGALYTGTGSAINGLHFLQQQFPGPMNLWITTWPLLGLVFTIAGVAHFTICDEFMNMMPAPGSWGFWYLPGSKRFHVLWTGIVEIIGGILLFAGGVSNFFGSQVLGSDTAASGALILLALTILVTPSNIYMYTHGARLPMNGPEIPVKFHYIRLSVQVILFAFLYILAEPVIEKLLYINLIRY